MQLIDKTTRLPLQKGQLVQDFRGETHSLDDWTAPPPDGPSTGRVWLSTKDGHQQGFYPSVINAAFVNEAEETTNQQ